MQKRKIKGEGCALPKVRCVRKTVIKPGYTEVYLTEKCRRALHRLTPEEHKLIANEYTAGGGYDEEEGIIYIVHLRDSPVHRRWPKIRQILKRHI